MPYKGLCELLKGLEFQERIWLSGFLSTSSFSNVPRSFLNLPSSFFRQVQDLVLMAKEGPQPNPKKSEPLGCRFFRGFMGVHDKQLPPVSKWDKCVYSEHLLN